MWTVPAAPWGRLSTKALDALVAIIVKAPADEKTRNQWLDRLWRAMAEDGVDYLSPVGDRWGEICGSVEVAGRWAEELVSTLRACWSDPNPGAYFHGATACLSCLLVAGRHQALLEFLEMPRYPSWSKNSSVLRYQYLNIQRTDHGAFVHCLKLGLQSTD
jgi:hypothetical protein